MLIIDYTAALTILPTLQATDPDDGPGMVGELTDRDALVPTLAALRAAGYEVSDSRDDDGVTWVWVTR